MKRKVYVYQNPLNPELESLFSSINENIVIDTIEDNLITITDFDYFNEEPIDLVSFQELIQEDFGGDVTMFIEPYLEEGFGLGILIKEILNELPHNVYFFEDVIPYVILKQKDELRHLIIEYLTMKTNKEVIHTVREFIENNLNSSLSAKKLFMHRNTLNYRLDNFISATDINVRTFKGANAIYMLFKY